MINSNRQFQNFCEYGLKGDFTSFNLPNAFSTSFTPNIMFNSRVSSQKLGSTDTALCSPSLNKVKQNKEVSR